MANIFDLFKKIESGNDTKNDTPPEFLIVGLGNPGSKYENTRHNAGFMFVDSIAKELNLEFSLNKQLKCFIADKNIN